MKPQIYHVDAFTSQPFRGNSAGVVFPADNLSEAQMQLIARELGHSETAFLLHSDDSDVRIRYFTPTVEVPPCFASSTPRPNCSCITAYNDATSGRFRCSTACPFS